MFYISKKGKKHFTEINGTIQDKQYIVVTFLFLFENVKS